MISLNVTTALLGLGLTIVIMALLRSDHLRMIHGLFWLCIAASAATLGLWPGLMDAASRFVGINYPPAFLLLTTTIVLLVKALYTDIEHTRMERNIRVMTQRLAIFELRQKMHIPDAEESNPKDSNHLP